MLPPPGVYYRGYLANYSADKNEALPDGGKVNVTALVNRAVWVTPQKLLGADVVLDTLVPLVKTDIELNGIDEDDRTTKSGGQCHNCRNQQPCGAK